MSGKCQNAGPAQFFEHVEGSHLNTLLSLRPKSYSLAVYEYVVYYRYYYARTKPSDKVVCLYLFDVMFVEKPGRNCNPLADGSQPAPRWAEVFRICTDEHSM